MMPGLDGFGLLHELRADPSLREVPVILVSARAGEEARTEGIAAGADDYVTKPFSAKELSARVRTAIELHKIRREAREQIQRSEAKADRVISSNPRYMLQLREGEKLHGQNRQVQHVIELLDEAYRA